MVRTIAFVVGLLAVAAACIVMMAPSGCNGVAPIAIEETPIKVLAETKGRGRPAEPGDLVCIDYRLLLPDGDTLMAEKEFCFYLGRGAVIAAVDEAVIGMSAAGRRVVKVPPHKHWGRAGYGDGRVPPNATLTLHVRLKSLDRG